VCSGPGQHIQLNAGKPKSSHSHKHTPARDRRGAEAGPQFQQSVQMPRTQTIPVSAERTHARTHTHTHTACDQKGTEAGPLFSSKY
jgi:hypothetical protein